MKTSTFKLRQIPIAVLASIGQGEGEDEITKEALDAAVAAAVTKANETSAAKHLKETQGLTTKRDELMGTLKTATDKLKETEGIDIEALLALQSTVENDEILSLMASGKHSEALEKSTEKMRVTHAASLKELSDKLTASETSGNKNAALVDSLLIDGGSKSALIKAKGLDTALDDVALRARQVWKVEDGELVARDGEGEMIQGEKGPITMSEWTEGLKETAPHLFPASESARAKGGKGGVIDLTDINGQMVAAANAGDMDLYNKLRKEKKEAAKR